MILQKKRKIVVSFLASCMLLIGLLPVNAYAADYAVSINGTAITDANAGDVLEDGTVSYDSTSNTLSLNGASLEQIVNATGEKLTINVSGDNTVRLTSGSEDLIESDSPVTITGSEGATLTLSGVNQNSYISCINAQGDVVVEKITLVLTNSNFSGINSTGNITVQDGATVKGDTGYMFYATSEGYGKLTVTDSTVIAPLEGTSVSGWMSAWVNEMDISDSTVDIVAPNGIYAAGDINIRNSSDVKVTASGRVTPYPGIYAGRALTITDSDVEATSYTYAGLYSSAGDITITGGSIKASTTASGSTAILSKQKLTINGPVTVETTTVDTVGYRGNAGVVINTSAETSNALYEVYTGATADEETELEDSPFASATDVSEPIAQSPYFRIAEHTHTGGTATCASPAICETCGNEYGAKDPANHVNLKMVEATSATHLQEGNILYYYCDGCNRYFSDAAATEEISYEDTVIPKLEGHTPDGTGWHSDEDSHWHTCACGAVIDEADHMFQWVTDKAATATEAGSKHEECTVCGYKKAAVAIPATGTAATPSPSGGGQSTTSTTSSPSTGDDTNQALWFGVLTAACLCMAGAVWAKVRRKQDRF